AAISSRSRPARRPPSPPLPSADLSGASPSHLVARRSSWVLHELRIENLLLIERAELRFESGLNVITGETGAGKTVLAHSLDLLLGGRARPQIVRPGASEAYVGGVFEVPDGLRVGPELGGLRDAAGAALAAIANPDGEGADAAAAVSGAGGALGAAAGVDGALDALGERVAALSLELDDVAAELRSYLDGLDADPARLEAI